MDYLKFIILNGREVIVYKTGEVLTLSRDKYGNRTFKVPKQNTTTNGYPLLNINGKRYRCHRIIAMCFLGLDIENTKLFVDHIDGNIENNVVSNLRLVTNQQNCFNHKDVKGYRKQGSMYQARITIDYKEINLGYFNSPEEARQAYLDAKSLYHKME